MVSAIAANFDAALGSCMLDAFYVHIRLLAGLVVRPTSAKDFGPADFGVKWTPPQSEAASRLDEAWDVASKNVVHFGRSRGPADTDGPARPGVDGAYLRQLASDALEVYASFVDAVAEHTPIWTDGARIPDHDREPEAWNVRVRAEALRELRSAGQDARSRLV